METEMGYKIMKCWAVAKDIIVSIPFLAPLIPLASIVVSIVNITPHHCQDNGPHASVNTFQN